jgi:fructose-bisphosphate aldolase class I
MYDETIRQKTLDGKPFTEVLGSQKIIPGIKVDKGARNLAGFPDEKVTEGLDGLRERLAEYRDLGAKFAKWRAVISIGCSTPTRTCIAANAHALARYAALCQEAGLIPVVEPEVLMDGDHSISRCFEVTDAALRNVFSALSEHRVVLEQMLLKASMVLSGSMSRVQADVREVAETTLRCLRRTVPAAVPGIVFLSGGQHEVRATEHLNAMNQIDAVPWQLSFSYARGLQAPALHAWNGRVVNVTSAQQALLHRAQCNSTARYGRYSSAIELGQAAA